MVNSNCSSLWTGRDVSQPGSVSGEKHSEYDYKAGTERTSVVSQWWHTSGYQVGVVYYLSLGLVTPSLMLVIKGLDNKAQLPLAFSVRYWYEVCHNMWKITRTRLPPSLPPLEGPILLQSRSMWTEIAFKSGEKRCLVLKRMNLWSKRHVKPTPWGKMEGNYIVLYYIIYSTSFNLISREEVMLIGVVYPEQVQLADKDCHSTSSPDKFTLRTGFLDCGTEFSFSDDRSEYKFSSL